MKEDLRICPYCKKQPPYGKEWQNFDKHWHDCLKRQTRKQEANRKAAEPKNTPTQPQEPSKASFQDFMDTLFGGKK